MNAFGASRRAGFEHRFFLLAWLAIFAAVVAGSARTYYLKLLFGTPALPWLVHLHGALMTAWQSRVYRSAHSPDLRRSTPAY